MNPALLALVAALASDAIVLRDSGLDAAVSPARGGELSSLVVRFRGAPVELLYSSPAFRGNAPLLWPAVGGQYPLDVVPASSCTEGSFAVGGRRFPMPCHGFAQNLPWRVVSRSATSVTLELRDTDETRRHYPFAFRLRAAYALRAGRLIITYTVSAGRTNTAPMPFSIGNHLSLRVPFLPGTAPGDMLFETPSTVELLRDAHGLVTAETRPRSFSKPTRLASVDASVALPLAGYRGPVFARVADPQGLALRISHRASSPLPEPLVQFNVYGGPRQGYFCPEPWFGLQNSLNRGQGLIQLAPGADWSWTVEIQPEGE